MTTVCYTEDILPAIDVAEADGTMLRMVARPVRGASPTEPGFYLDFARPIEDKDLNSYVHSACHCATSRIARPRSARSKCNLLCSAVLVAFLFGCVSLVSVWMRESAHLTCHLDLQV